MEVTEKSQFQKSVVVYIGSKVFYSNMNQYSQEPNFEIQIVKWSAHILSMSQAIYSSRNLQAHQTRKYLTRQTYYKNILWTDQTNIDKRETEGHKILLTCNTSVSKLNVKAKSSYCYKLITHLESNLVCQLLMNSRYLTFKCFFIL